MKTFKEIEDKFKDTNMIVINGKEIWRKNSYGWYTADYVRYVGKPRIRIDCEFESNWFSTTKCKQMKQPVKDGEEPVAFARSQKGYYPVYERNIEV